MSTRIDIAFKTRKHGCFLRNPDMKDVVDTFYTHKGTFVLYGRSEESRQLQDWALQRLQSRVDEQAVSDYKKRVYALFFDPDQRSVEQLDTAIQRLRCTCFGEETMEDLHRTMMQEPCVPDPRGGIDQRAKKEDLLKMQSSQHV